MRDQRRTKHSRLRLVAAGAVIRHLNYRCFGDLLRDARQRACGHAREAGSLAADRRHSDVRSLAAGLSPDPRTGSHPLSDWDCGAGDRPGCRTYPVWGQAVDSVPGAGFPGVGIGKVDYNCGVGALLCGGAHGLPLADGFAQGGSGRWGAAGTNPAATGHGHSAGADAHACGWSVSGRNAVETCRGGCPYRASDAAHWLARFEAVSERKDYLFPAPRRRRERRSEEHTSELQSRQYLVCRLLLEKKKDTNITPLAARRSEQPTTI